MADFVDNVGGFLEKDFAGQHSDTVCGIAVSHELGQPIGFGDSVRVEQRDPVAARAGESGVICFAKPRVGWKKYRLRLRQTLGP